MYPVWTTPCQRELLQNFRPLRRPSCGSDFANAKTSGRSTATSDAQHHLASAARIAQTARREVEGYGVAVGQNGPYQNANARATSTITPMMMAETTSRFSGGCAK